MTTAQRENSVIVLEDDYKTKYQSYDPNSPESYISHQLQWMAYYESSLLFASEVVNNLIVKPLTPRRLVVDQDIFQVLVEANMPAVLLELAFVTNPEEYRYLSSATGQEEVATRLFNAFKSYKTKFDESVKVTPSAQPAPQVAVKKDNASEFYSIQIMGLGRLLRNGDPALKGLTVTPVKSTDSNIYKYVYGNFATAQQAREVLPETRKTFPEAFVVKVVGNVVERVR
jgi:N-acetylmuramoyl-L-alanine amidase